MAAGRSRVVCTPHEGEPAMPIPPDDLESAVLVVRDLSGHLPGRTQIYRLVWAITGPNSARTSGDRQVPPPTRHPDHLTSVSSRRSHRGDLGSIWRQSGPAAGWSLALQLPLPRSALLQRHSGAVYPATTSPWRDVPPPLFFPLGGLRLSGCGRSRLLRLLFLRIADIDIMRGRRHRYHRTGGVAEAIVAHRPSQQTIESDVFAGPDHKKLRVLRPAHKDLARVPAHEFQHPIPMRGRRLGPGDEGASWPGLAVGGDPTYAVFRRWHVEHDDVVAVIGENRIQVTAVHRIGPVLNERPDLCRVVTHVSADHGRPANSSLPWSFSVRVCSPRVHFACRHVPALGSRILFIRRVKRG